MRLGVLDRSRVSKSGHAPGARYAATSHRLLSSAQAQQACIILQQLTSWEAAIYACAIQQERLNIPGAQSCWQSACEVAIAADVKNVHISAQRLPLRAESSCMIARTEHPLDSCVYYA